MTTDTSVTEIFGIDLEVYPREGVVPADQPDADPTLAVLIVTEVSGVLLLVIVNTPLLIPAWPAVPAAVVTPVTTLVLETVKEGSVPADQLVISSAEIAVPAEAEPIVP